MWIDYSHSLSSAIWIHPLDTRSIVCTYLYYTAVWEADLTGNRYCAVQNLRQAEHFDVAYFVGHQISYGHSKDTDRILWRHDIINRVQQDSRHHYIYAQNNCSVHFNENLPVSGPKQPCTRYTYWTYALPAISTSTGGTSPVYTYYLYNWLIVSTYSS